MQFVDEMAFISVGDFVDICCHFLISHPLFASSMVCWEK